MYKKTITYTDYEGETRTEDFYFNLTKAELIELQSSEAGGLEKMLNRVVAERNQGKIIAVFKKIILAAYGEKSADGKRFVKKDKDGTPLSQYFEETEAYAELFTKLLTKEEAATEFVNSIVPADIAKQIPQNVNA